MTFAIFDDPHVEEALDYLVKSPKLAVFVGAGVSAEAGIPAWPELITRLLHEAAAREETFGDDDERDAWVKRILATELPPAAAAIAEIILGDELPDVLRTELFTPQWPDDGSPPRKMAPGDFIPGPTAHAIAALRMACVKSSRHEPKMRIFTTNYDDLIERAFLAHREVKKKLVQSVTYPDRNRKAGGPTHIRIRHLNGMFPSGRDKPLGKLTLTDESFNMSDAVTTERDGYVTTELADPDRSCIFLGSSFGDPSIIRYIDKSAEKRRISTGGRKSSVGRQHVAIFTHHSEDPKSIQEVREDVTRRRLANRMTKAVYLDHYADLPTFMWELRNRLQGSDHAPRRDRARNVLNKLLSSVIASGDDDRYNERQPALNERAFEILRETVEDLDDKIGTLRLSREELAMSVWLLDEDGHHLTPWIATDRIHRGPKLLQKVPIQPGSRWLAVRAVCAGRLMKERRDDARSRWRYLVAFPLEIPAGQPDEERNTVTIGAVSLTSLSPKEETGLSGLDLHGEHLLRTELGGAVYRWLLKAGGLA